MAVAVDRLERDAAGALVVDARDLQGRTPVARCAGRRQEAAALEQVERLESQVPRRQLAPVRNADALADRMDAGEQAPQHGHLVVAKLVGRATTRARPEREVDALHAVQRVTVVEAHRRTHRDLRVAQREEHPVLVEDRLARPAPGPVELRDHVAPVLEAQVVDAVLEGVQGQAMTRRRETAALDRVEHALGREAKEELRVAPRARVDCRSPPFR